jgi:hypothetical protein
MAEETERDLNRRIFEENVDFLKENHMGRGVSIRKGQMYIAETVKEAAEQSAKDHPKVEHGYVFEVTPDLSKTPEIINRILPGVYIKKE